MLVVPEGVFLEDLSRNNPDKTIEDFGLIHFTESHIQAGGCDGFSLANCQRWMALGRLDWYWVRPHYGRTIAELPRQIQMLMWEESDGRYGMCVPLVDQGHRLRIDGPCPRVGRWDTEGDPREDRFQITNGFGIILDDTGGQPASVHLRAAWWVMAMIHLFCVMALRVQLKRF